jgi:EmrB/QacA subfamily drug resistance transporter
LSLLGHVAPNHAIEPSAQHRLLHIFPSIMLPVFMAVADQTIVAAALPAIVGSLGDVQSVSWVVLSYLLANTVAAPVYGRLGDAFGRRRLLLVALAVFMGASLLCALAGSMPTLILARALQGLGGSGLMVLAQALIGELVPVRERGTVQGYLAGVIVFSGAFGPVAGGFLTQSFGWPAVFLVNLPLGVVALVMARRLPRGAASSARLQFDAVGLGLFTVFVVPLLLGLEQAQHLDWAKLVWMAGLLALSATALMLLLHQERRAAQPLFPLKMLRQAGMWRANVMAGCSGALLVSEVTFVPMYLHVAGGASPGEIGLLMLPLTAAVGVGSLITGRLISRTGYTAIFPAIGQILAGVAMIVLAFGMKHLSLWEISSALAFVAIFQGTAMPVAQITAQALAGPGMLGSASAAIQLSRSVGSAIGVAIVGVVLFALLLSGDAQVVSFFEAMVQGGPDALAALSPDRQAAMQAIIANGFGGAFKTIGVFALLSGALAWTTPARRL